MLTIAALASTPAVRAEALSARPDAPVVTHTSPVRGPRSRAIVVAFLRQSAQRRVRLANRLDTGLLPTAVH